MLKFITKFCIMILNIPTQAQSFAQATCESGDWNPFKHDTGVATMHFCSSHPDGYSK